MFTAPPRPDSGATATNTVVMSNGKLDWDKPDTWTAMLDRSCTPYYPCGRSPCGSGTAAVMAARYGRGELRLGDTASTLVTRTSIKVHNGQPTPRGGVCP